MKSKKLLTLIIAIAVCVAVIVVFASVFAVRQVLPIYHNFEGGQMGSVSGAPTANDVLKFSKGKSILFLSKDALLSELNAEYTDWHAIGIVKSFPNILEVHFVKRVAVVKVDIGGTAVYLDSLGYVVDAPGDGTTPLDISSAFETPRLAKVAEKGKKLEFESEINNKRVGYVLESMMALWQCRCEIENIPTILGKDSGVFTFDEDGTMIITTGVKAKILVMAPSQILTSKLIDAFSVYCDPGYDLQKYGTVITVWPDGKVTRPDDSVLSH